MKALKQFIDDVMVPTAVRQVSVNIFGYDQGRRNLFIKISLNIFCCCLNQRPGLSIEHAYQFFPRNKFGLSFVHVMSRFVFDINQSLVIFVKGNSRHSRPRGRGIHLMSSF